MGLLTAQSNLLSLSLPGKTGWPWDTEVSHFSIGKLPWPKISVVTPSFNQAEFLEETIRSVLFQQYPNLEFIIIDGGSTDGSIEIIKKYASFLSYWCSEKDDGQSAAIIKGIKQSKGEIVNWLNSDDQLLPNALFHVAETYKKIGQIDSVICGQAVYIDEDSKIISSSAIKVIAEESKMLPFMPDIIGGVQASWFISRSAWEKVGGINSQYHYAMDIDLFFKCQLKSVSFKPLYRDIAAYRVHNMTKTKIGWDKSIQEKKKVYCSYLSFLNPQEQLIYKPRVNRSIFGLYMQSVSPLDNFRGRLKKIICAVREYPLILFTPYQVKRILQAILGKY